MKNHTSLLKYLEKKEPTKRLFEGIIMASSDAKDIRETLLRGPLRTDYFGVAIIRKGSLIISLNFSEKRIVENELLFLSPMVVIQLLECSDDIEMYTLFTDFDIYHKFGIPIYKAYSMENICQGNESVLSLKKEEIERYLGYIQNIEHQNTLTESTIFQEEIVKTTTMLFFYELGAKTTQQHIIEKESFESKNRIVMDFLDLASKNFKTNRSVQFYADKLLLSRKHLGKIVKEFTSLPPKAILDELAISEAIILMNVTTMTVKDVMVELGFYDFGTFSKFFKGAVGKSPMLYRKEKNLNKSLN